MPWRSSSSSACARRRPAGSPAPSANSGAVSDQRPWICGCAPARRVPKRRRRARSARRLLAPAGAHRARRAQRGERVVGHLARPHEVPQRLLQLLGGDAGDVDQQVGEEARALRAGARGSPRARARRTAPRCRCGVARRRARARRRPRGSTARPCRCDGRAGRRRPTRPRPTRTAGRARRPSRRRCGAAARRAPTPRRAARAPCSGTSISRSRSIPAPVGGWRSTPCQLGAKRASARWSAGSISARSAASDARRSRRRTSGSHHSRSVPPGRSSPRTSSPARSRPASTGVRSSP